MKNFAYYQPTEILFGTGRISELGKIVSGYGKRCLLVTVPVFPDFKPIIDRVKKILKDSGVEVFHFDGVVPNPTIDNISEGAKIAEEDKVDVVLGLGGGSSMDAAKAIAVEVSHDGTCWDYLWFKETQPGEKTLPVIAVTTTSGTGSQVTQVAVVTNPETRCKSAIYNPIIFPKVAIVDPGLMLTVPEHITASTGFDVFCHSFESWLHVNTSAYIEMMAKESIRLVVKYLPMAVKDGLDKKAREALAWADTLAGLCIANAGVTLPHGMGMAIGGMYPNVMHGEALAVLYPEFMSFTWQSDIKKFAQLSSIFHPDLNSEPDEIIAEKSCQILIAFLKQIGMWCNLKDFGIPEDELPELGKACMVLPDYKNNPRVATLDDIMNILRKSYSRI